MAINSYYGYKSGTTMLQIFTQPNDGSDAIVHRRVEDQEAYDTWHLSYYFKEILTYDLLLKKKMIQFNDLIRNEKNLFLYLLLAKNPSINSIMELGSSLYEMIDGLNVVKKYVQDQRLPLPALSLESYEYLGVELSDMLAQSASLIHPEYQIRRFKNADKVDRKFDLLYERSVTNYVFSTTKQMAEFVNKSNIALLNTYFSLGNTFNTTRLGKTMTYFSLQEAIDLLEKPLYHLFGFHAPGPISGPEYNRDNPVVEGFFLCCEPDVVKEFSETGSSLVEIEDYFIHKEIIPKPAFMLLHER